MTNQAASHENHWDTSIWPLLLSVGILFLSLAFVFYFVYQHAMAAIVSLGIGTPIIIASILGWIREAIGEEVGLSTASMGWFILAEAMIFLSLFANYWLQRLLTPNWPPVGTPANMPVVLPAIMTVVLVSSSFTIHAGEVRLVRGDNAGFLRWLAITIVLGLLFFGMSYYEWSHLFHQGFDTSTNQYSTSFFSITGFHGAHVLVGIGIFLFMLFPARKGKVNHSFVKTGSLYWHFVDIVWIFVVSQVYYW